jgi:pre-rRNA-processing protein TSR3
MPSSASTRSLRSPPIRLGIVVVGDDHARACTGRRLIRLGLARAIRSLPTRADRPIVLDPFAERPLTPADRAHAEAGGLVAVDCSWNRLSATNARAPRSGAGPGQRRLPLLIATNPQHYGRLGELNTAEALSAGLFVLGRSDDASRLLAGFAGGPSFLEVNHERLRRYARASSVDDLLAAERALFGGGDRAHDA